VGRLKLHGDRRMKLHNQVIVITGASSGFGEAIARRCAAAGAQVVLAARSGERLGALAAELGVGRALAVPCDVTSDDDVRRLAEATLACFGRVDVLVNNAGFGVLELLKDAPLADLEAMMDVNLYGAVRCTQAFLPGMLARRRGQIVAMASLAGLVATPNMGYYSMTKFALVAYARTLMLELTGSGVRCALLLPGVARTGFQTRADIGRYPRSSRLVPWLQADDVARVVVRAIARRREGEIVLPWQARPLVAVAGAFPGLARHILRIVR
jgi:short-subunit dehydrogenase